MNGKSDDLKIVGISNSNRIYIGISGSIDIAEDNSLKEQKKLGDYD